MEPGCLLEGTTEAQGLDWVLAMSQAAALCLAGELEDLSLQPGASSFLFFTCTAAFGPRGPCL